MTEAVKKVLAARMGGGRPSMPRALMVAAGMGVAAAGITYRVLRG